MNLTKAIQAVSSMEGYEAKINGASNEKHLYTNGLSKPKKIIAEIERSNK